MAAKRMLQSRGGQGLSWSGGGHAALGGPIGGGGGAHSSTFQRHKQAPAKNVAGHWMSVSPLLFFLKDAGSIPGDFSAEDSRRHLSNLAEIISKHYFAGEKNI